MSTLSAEFHPDKRYYLKQHGRIAEGRVRYPDFTIADHASGITFYWEHLGMLEDPSYRSRWERKRAEYIAAGIKPYEEEGSPEGTLIETRDDARGGLDSGKIANLIEKIFGC